MSNYSLTRKTIRETSATNSKNKIINVALSLFIKRGIKSTTTKEIAKKAGIAEGTIYKHFKSKNDLAIELFTVNMDMFREKLLENTSSYADPKDILKGLIQDFFDFAKKQPKSYSYIMEAHSTELPRIPKKHPKPKDTFIKAIHLGIEKGDFREIDENLGAALVIGMITRAILFFSHGFIDLDYNKVVSEVTNSAIKVLEK